MRMGSTPLSSASFFPKPALRVPQYRLADVLRSRLSLRDGGSLYELPRFIIHAEVTLWHLPCRGPSASTGEGFCFHAPILWAPKNNVKHNVFWVDK